MGARDAILLMKGLAVTVSFNSQQQEYSESEIHGSYFKKHFC